MSYYFILLADICLSYPIKSCLLLTLKSFSIGSSFGLASAFSSSLFSCSSCDAGTGSSDFNFVIYWFLLNTYLSYLTFFSCNSDILYSNSFILLLKVFFLTVSGERLRRSAKFEGSSFIGADYYKDRGMDMLSDLLKESTTTELI